MRKTIGIILLLFLLLPVVMQAQLYIKYTDGRCKVYIEPDTQSRVIGTLKQFDLLKDATEICGNNEDYRSLSPEWIPIALGPNEKIGYVKQEHLRQVDLYNQNKEDNGLHEIEATRYSPFKLVESEEDHRWGDYKHYKADADSILFGDRQNGVFIAVNQVDTINYNVEKRDGWFATTVNGCSVIGGSSAGVVALKEFSVFWKGKKYPLPEEYIQKYFLGSNLLGESKLTYKDEVIVYHNIVVLEGPEDEMYVWLAGGDGAESFTFIWVVHHGRLVAEFSDSAC